MASISLKVRLIVELGDQPDLVHIEQAIRDAINVYILEGKITSDDDDTHINAVSVSPLVIDSV